MLGLMDCNNFFVSCERLFRPDLLGKPVAVLSSNDGCIVARSEEVKHLGIPMGAPVFQVEDVIQKHNVVLFSSNFTLYRDISARVMSALREECDGVSVYSIDEAFFKVEETTHESLQRLRSRIIEVTGIPVSIGTARTRTRAKLASKCAKQSSGTFMLDDAYMSEHAHDIPIGTVWGIGREMTATLTRAGITTVGAFLDRGRSYARATFGVVGERIFYELMGKEAVVGEDAGRVEASITSTRSFRATTHKKDVVMGALAYHVAHVGEKLRERGHMARELTVLAYPSRYDSHAHVPGSARATLDVYTDSTLTLMKHAELLFSRLYRSDVPYKKAGVLVGDIVPKEYVAPSLLTGDVREKASYVYDIVDALNSRFGSGTVRPGLVMGEETWGARRDVRSPEYTTQWGDIQRVKAI